MSAPTTHVVTGDEQVLRQRTIGHQPHDDTHTTTAIAARRALNPNADAIDRPVRRSRISSICECRWADRVGGA